MARAKIKRGSTNVDMTAMCDVAFLLLSFFILTGQFKPSEAVEVNPPSSVSNAHAPQKDAFLVSIDKDNRVFLSLTDDIKSDVWDELVTEKNLKVTPQDKKDFMGTDFIGVPFDQLLQFIQLTPDQRKNVKMPGIPTDSTDNQLQAWISAAATAGEGKKLNFLIKGDNSTKYPAFSQVIEAFKKNDIYKYNLVTNAEDVPAGTPLYEDNLKAQHAE
ncbi:MAG: biopolymer transporter ExbD [Ginsengibacter sp.]